MATVSRSIEVLPQVAAGQDFTRTRDLMLLLIHLQFEAERGFG